MTSLLPKIQMSSGCHPRPRCPPCRAAAGGSGLPRRAVPRMAPGRGWERELGGLSGGCDLGLCSWKPLFLSQLDNGPEVPSAGGESGDHIPRARGFWRALQLQPALGVVDPDSERAGEEGRRVPSKTQPRLHDCTVGRRWPPPVLWLSWCDLEVAALGPDGAGTSHSGGRLCAV